MYLSHCDNSKAKIPCFCFLLRARGSILLQLSPCAMGCYPSSVRQKFFLQPVLNWRNSHVKNFIDRVGGFWLLLCCFSALCSKKAEKMPFFDIVGAFLQCAKLYAFLMLWRCGVYSFVFYVVMVSCCVGVVIFWGVFWWVGVILGAGIFGDAVNVGRCSFEGVIFWV